jgi:hypothetical protein
MRNVLPIYAVITLLSLLIVSQAMSLVSANPFIMWKEISPPFDANPPIITINSPENRTIYSNGFNVSFSIRPAQYKEQTSNIVEVAYTIDNITETPFSIWQNWSIGGLPKFSSTFQGPSLSVGNHSLRVWALGATYLLPSKEVFFVNSSSQVFFTLQENLESEDSTLGGSVMVGLNATSVTIIASCVAIIAVASISLVYFSRKKGKP